jgi:hypothetical protein
MNQEILRRLDRFSISFESASLLGELDRLPALERLGGFISQQLGFQPTLQRGARRDTLGESPRRKRPGPGSSFAPWLEPAGMQAVLDDFITDITRHPQARCRRDSTRPFEPNTLMRSSDPYPVRRRPIWQRAPRSSGGATKLVSIPDFGHFRIHQGRPEHPG